MVKGKSVTITSGLLKALQGKGIEDIAEIRYTERKALVKDFIAGFRGRRIGKTNFNSTDRLFYQRFMGDGFCN